MSSQRDNCLLMHVDCFHCLQFSSVLYLGKDEEKANSRLFMLIMFWQWIAPVLLMRWGSGSRRDGSYLLLPGFLPLRINL